MIDALFPGKQGFFAYFLYYADSAGFAQFVANGTVARRDSCVELLRVVRTLHRSLVTGQYQAILHKLTTLRLFAKLAGFLFFAAHWRVAVRAPDKTAPTLFFAWVLVSSFTHSLPLDVEALAREAGESGCYELFLLWAPELFHFVTDAMVRGNAQLKGFFLLVTAYYLLD